MTNHCDLQGTGKRDEDCDKYPNRGFSVRSTHRRPKEHLTGWLLHHSPFKQLSLRSQLPGIVVPDRINQLL